MKAMVLAAGLGTRLRPLTEDRPKPLVPVDGRPLITYNLALLQYHGITDVIVNLHHRGEALRTALGDGSAVGLRLHYSVEEPLLDTGGAIKKVEPLLASEDEFLVLNGDTIVDCPLDRLIAEHRARGATATLVLRTDPRQDVYGLVEVDAARRIRRFLGVPEMVAAPLTPYMFAGVQVLSRRVFGYMPAGGAFSMTRAIYPAMLAAGEPLYGYPFAGFWRVVDTVDDLRRAEADIRAEAGLSYFRARVDT
jgi:NDP-sugar pyrophosphorylase family protein